MNTATLKSMNLNLHLQSGGKTESFQMPSEMKKLVEKLRVQQNMTFSAYVKYAINNQIERDLVNTNI